MNVYKSVEVSLVSSPYAVLTGGMHWNEAVQCPALLCEVRNVTSHCLAQDGCILQVIGERGHTLGHTRLEHVERRKCDQDERG